MRQVSLLEIVQGAPIPFSSDEEQSFCGCDWNNWVEVDPFLCFLSPFDEIHNTCADPGPNGAGFTHSEDFVLNNNTAVPFSEIHSACGNQYDDENGHTQDSMLRNNSAYDYRTRGFGTACIEDPALVYNAASSIQKIARGISVRDRVADYLELQAEQGAACVIQERFRHFLKQCPRPETRKIRFIDAIPTYVHLPLLADLVAISNDIDRLKKRNPNLLARRFLADSLHQFFRKYWRRHVFSAVTIQRYMKGVWTRRTFKKIMGVVRACKSLQRRFRSQTCRLQYKKLLQSVIKIQAFYRRRLSHKKFAVKPPTSTTNCLQNNEPLAEFGARSVDVWVQKQAATRIQTIVRGYACRSRRRQLLTLLARLQGMVRSHLLSSKRTRARQASTLIQNRFRSFMAQRNFKILQSRVVLVQTVVRSRIAHNKDQLWMDQRHEPSITDLSAALAQPLDDLVEDMLGVDADCPDSKPKLLAPSHMFDSCSSSDCEDEAMEDDLNHEQAVLAIQRESQGLDRLFALGESHRPGRHSSAGMDEKESSGCELVVTPQSESLDPVFSSRDCDL